MKVRTVDLILYFCMTDHLLMRSLRARKASIFLTSDFLFQIRFKISAFVRYLYIIIYNTRPKPAFGRQGLDWDRWARIQFSQVHFGAFCH